MASDIKEPVQADRSYTLEQFSAATGIGPRGVRAAEKRGLRTTKVGGRKHVLGRDWIDFLASDTDRK